MGLALLLLGAWIVLSATFGPAMIARGPEDAWFFRVGHLGLAIGTGMIVCGGALL